MLAFTLTEVMDNSVKLLSLQGIYLMYLYVGSIAVIICIYIWVLIDSCSSINNDSTTGLVPRTITTGVIHDKETDVQNLSSLTKFGSLKKAHISRDRTSNTSFYLRIGAIVFGLGTLVFNGLEMAMHSMMEGSCLNDVVFVHPILHGLFTFLQMHFLFVNSQVLVEKFGLAARFGFMHLAATNLALWIRLVIWESGNEWTHYVFLSINDKNYESDVPTPLHLRSFPKFITRVDKDSLPYHVVSNEHINQVVSLHQCLNTNSLGQLWTSSMPFLYPFIIQFSIIAAAVTYIMGQNVAKDHLFFQKQKKIGMTDSKSCTLATTLHESFNTWGVDCGGASKGLFLGILCLVTGVVVIIIFLVVKANEDFPAETIFWLINGTLMAILSITIIMNVIGLIQIRKLSVIGTKLPSLDKILSVSSIFGVQLYTIMGIVAGSAGTASEETLEEISSPLQKRHSMLLAVSLVQLVQTIMQSCFIVEGMRRTSLSRTQIVTKPARQVVTFLMFSNSVLWAFDTFVIQNWMSQELQIRFFGILAWGVISRISLPLLIFYRFHSCVLLLEIWKKSYHSIHVDPGN
ncbi:predicted protein [Pediculus humanus corporis]|uniref:Predicted protein n=1 Tax=Pediculus humanus subsp. corporis TaxID=121224 RepID=E0VDJ5_PEDHC|nr:uncharacterized protein Phum_PHUM117570 [Pediculus humanus corporis]EEB11451.1 predicted protein [Pediculus humanus corporis]